MYFVSFIDCKLKIIYEEGGTNFKITNYLSIKVDDEGRIHGLM